MKRMRNRTAGVAVAVIVLSALTGGVLGSRVLATADRETERSRSYAAALAVVESQYVEPVDATQLIYGSIEGMLRTLDPHSTFFDPKTYAQMRERQEGHYYGIGISIGAVDGDITVTQLFEGSPAYRAGIRRGDIIAFVPCDPNDPQPQPKKDAAKPAGPCMDSTKGWQTDQVVKRIKGPKGTAVGIAIRRPGVNDLINLTVDRDEINITTVRTAFMIAPATGYVRVEGFSETTDTELQAALKKLKPAGMQKLILDLRDNPGGPLNQAIAVANHFLHKGQMIVYTRGRVENSDEDYRATTEGDYTDVPLIVLTSRQSASASEIVTGSMQDHDRGLVIGETTFGKALVQSVYSIDSAGLALTTAHYYTPSGRLIQRPWDGSFDEYLTYTLRDQSANRTHPASELKYTDGGRKVYGGGGIEPDHFIAGAVEGFNVSNFSRALVQRGAFVSFAEKFTKEGDTRPAAKSAAVHKVAAGWDVTDAIFDEFKQFLVAEHFRVDEAAMNADRAFIKAEIHFEVDNDLFSAEEARRNIVKVDPQAQAALGYFDEARKLLDLNAKKIVGQ
jgi:carboxyl-terminal processing protease